MDILLLLSGVVYRRELELLESMTSEIVLTYFVKGIKGLGQTQRTFSKSHSQPHTKEHLDLNTQHTQRTHTHIVSTMSKAGGLEIPTLDEWAKQRLTAVVTAKTQQSYDKAFDAFISQNVRITFNGKSLTRDEYKRRIRSEETFQLSSSADIRNIVEAGKFDTPDLQVSDLY